MSDTKKNTDGTAVDSELNDLLNSALEDFDKLPTTVAAKDESKEVVKTVSHEDEEEDVEEVSEEVWSKDFIKEAADHFEKHLQNLIQNGEEGDLGSSLQKMAQSVGNAIGTTSAGEGDIENVDFQAAIAQALKDLSVTSEKLQNNAPGISEADLKAMFGQTSLETGANEFLPFMEGMMHSLLSKEILYPSLKELVDKYPAWLEEKKSTIPEADLQRYSKQLTLMQQVCTELENEKDGDTEDVKKRRFQTILSQMQEMQSYGHPPEELVGEQPALFQYDGEGAPILTGLPPGIDGQQNCTIM